MHQLWSRQNLRPLKTSTRSFLFIHLCIYCKDVPVVTSWPTSLWSTSQDFTRQIDSTKQMDRMKSEVNIVFSREQHAQLTYINNELIKLVVVLPTDYRRVPCGWSLPESTYSCSPHKDAPPRCSSLVCLLQVGYRTFKWCLQLGKIFDLLDDLFPNLL